jgi:hypothetical protein
VVFAGSVFSEVLVWTVHLTDPVESDATVTHRLSGHEGVIFRKADKRSFFFIQEDYLKKWD